MIGTAGVNRAPWTVSVGIPQSFFASQQRGPLKRNLPVASVIVLSAFLLALFETAIAKMRVFRVPEFLGAALMLGLLATLLLFVSRSL